MTISGYSQNSYPKKIVLDNDTLIIVTTDQLKAANEKMILGEYYHSLSDTLIKEKTENLKALSRYQGIVTKQKNLYEIAEEQINSLKESMKVREEICEEEKTIINKKLWRDRLIYGLIGIGIGLLI